MTVVTNHVPRPLLDSAELTPSEREKFDYLDWPALDEGTDSATFFRYRGEVYDLAEFMVGGEPGWDGSMADSFFSGLLVKIVDDGESVIVGRWLS